VRASYDVLIVGGGQGGAQAALMLRQLGFGGTVAIIGDEPELPYDRPPLSKEYLAGTKNFTRMLFQSAEGWRERNVTLFLQQMVTAIDPANHTVATAGGDRLGYGRLIWSTGGTPRRLNCAGHDLGGVYTVRKRADIEGIRAALPAVDRVVIIGGGYIGLEAAAVLSQLGKQVTVLEAEDRVLARVAGEPLSRFYEAEHRCKGVDIRLGARVGAIEGEEGHAKGVRLSDGVLLPAEMIIVGIGIAPAVEPLLAAGAEATNGVRVDEFCRSSLADIYVVGDCAEHRNHYAGDEWIRLESVQNANDHATTVARQITGQPQPYEAVPWFWSNQFDLRLQTVGIARGYDDVVVRGDPAGRSFSVIYLRRRKVVALDCVNAVRDYAQGKLLVMGSIAADRAALADPAVPLKSLLGEARAF
jgi:3-phenylpropionate/trans-cinnamate dioxygenase ferredoxin reductase subunit